MKRERAQDTKAVGKGKEDSFRNTYFFKQKEYFSDTEQV